METNLKLTQTDGDLLADPTSYRRLIGNLIYLTITRLDLSYSVNRLSQFLAAPRTSHLQVALRILQYIKKTPGQGLFFPSNSTIQLNAFVDADWGHALILDALLLVSVYFLVPHLFLGGPRSNKWSPVLPPKLNIALWPTLLVRLFGYSVCFIKVQLFFTVIIKLPFTIGVHCSQPSLS